MLLVQAMRLAAAYGVCNHYTALRQISEMETRLEALCSCISKNAQASSFKYLLQLILCLVGILPG